MDIQKKQKIVVSAFIEKDGKFLIVQRSSHDTRVGQWETPGGGLEWGEDPSQGVMREVKEECGLDVEVVEPFKVLSWTSKRNDIETHKVQIMFRCKLKDQAQDVVLSHEHTQYRWIDETELKSLHISFFLESLSPKT